MGFWPPETPNIPGLPNGIGLRTAAGNGIFGCRDGRLKSGRRDRKRHRRTERAERYRAKIPKETAYLESAPGFAVSQDWMVADAVQRNRSLWQRKSDIREKYREDEELGPKKSLRRQENPASTQVFRPVPVQRLTGPDFGITGKLTANNRERVLNFTRAWLYCRRRSRAASGHSVVPSGLSERQNHNAKPATTERTRSA